MKKVIQVARIIGFIILAAILVPVVILVGLAALSFIIATWYAFVGIVTLAIIVALLYQMWTSPGEKNNTTNTTEQ